MCQQEYVVEYKSNLREKPLYFRGACCIYNCIYFTGVLHYVDLINSFILHVKLHLKRRGRLCTTCSYCCVHVMWDKRWWWERFPCLWLLRVHLYNCNYKLTLGLIALNIWLLTTWNIRICLFVHGRLVTNILCKNPVVIKTGMSRRALFKVV